MAKLGVYLTQCFRARKWWLILLLFVTLGLLAWGYQQYLTADRFPIKTVSVHASYQHLSFADIEAIVLPTITSGFFKAKLGNIERLLNKLEWVASSHVKRTWLSGIAIHVKEHIAVARWGEQALLTKAAHLFYGVRTGNEHHLVLLQGPKNYHTQVLHEYHQIQAKFRPLGLVLKAYTMDDNNARELLLSNGCALYLGRRTIEARLKRFMDVYSHAFRDKLKLIAYIDLRYAHGMAVKWRSSTHTDV